MCAHHKSFFIAEAYLWLFVAGAQANIKSCNKLNYVQEKFLTFVSTHNSICWPMEAKKYLINLIQFINVFGSSHMKGIEMKYEARLVGT